MYFQLNKILNKLHLMSSCLKIFNLIKFNIIIIRYGTSNNYYTEQDAFLLVMLCPVGKAGRARHHYSSCQAMRLRSTT